MIVALKAALMTAGMCVAIGSSVIAAFILADSIERWVNGQ